MTALHALHHQLTPPGKERAAKRPAPADVIPMTEHDARNLPVATGPTHLTAQNGTRLMAGLTWEIATGPETPVLRANAPAVLRLPERRAVLSDPDHNGTASSLLLAMADGLIRVLPGTSGAWVFMAELPAPDGASVIWTGVADLQAAEEDDDAAGAVPRPGPEGLFIDPDAALTALQKHLTTTEIAGIATMWRPGEETQRGRVHQDLAHIAPSLPLEDVELDPLLGDLPCFVAPRQVPVRLLGGLGAGVALLLAAIFVVVPTIQDVFRAPPPPPPEMVPVEIEPGAFATACTTALDAWWPRSVGWQVTNTGCALATHLPEGHDLPRPEQTDHLVAPLIIWRHLAPEDHRNSVLARAAAEQVVATWPHAARLDADGLMLWQSVDLPLMPAPDGTGPTTTSDPDQMHTRLAALWADAPDAVARTSGTGTGLFTITLSTDTPPAALFDRAGGVPGIAPARLVQSSRDIELVLAPVISRNVPTTFFPSHSEEKASP